MKRAGNGSPDREEKSPLNIRMLEQIPSAQSRAASSFCFIIAFQLCDRDESFLKEERCSIACDKTRRTIFQKHARSLVLSRGALLRRAKLHAGLKEEISRSAITEKHSNRSCVYTLRSIFSCSNSLPCYYSLPLIIIANWSLVLPVSFSPPLPLSFSFSPCSSSWRIMKTVPWLRSSFRVSRVVITVASRKISPRGQGVSAAVVFSSFFVSLFRIVH